MARSDKPDNLNTIINLIIKINNRLYKCNLKKKGHYLTQYKKNGHNYSSYSLIELDAIS
jgi:hypothetical protein